MVLVCERQRTTVKSKQQHGSFAPANTQPGEQLVTLHLLIDVTTNTTLNMQYIGVVCSQAVKPQPT
jgi:hypothetical protein